MKKKIEELQASGSEAIIDELKLRVRHVDYLEKEVRDDLLDYIAAKVKAEIAPLVEILETNGLLLDVKNVWEGTRRYKWYYVSFCPRISDDGYIVDENGEKILPDLSKY